MLQEPTSDVGPAAAAGQQAMAASLSLGLMSTRAQFNVRCC